jgi:hypothetical protein
VSVASDDVDLVLFEAGGRRWAADAWAVLRIDRPREGARLVELCPCSGTRALVVRADASGEAEVPIDRLIGFQRVEARALRPLPAYSRPLAPPALAGAWLTPESVVLLVDLHTLVREDVAVCATPPAKP